MTVDDLNTSFRGDVYGERPAMDAASFVAHVERNGVDLARSRRWTVDGALSGMVLLAFRGARAWIGGFGVVNEPARGVLHDAFAAHAGWRELARQHRMRLALR